MEKRKVSQKYIFCLRRYTFISFAIFLNFSHNFTHIFEIELIIVNHVVIFST